MLDDMLIKVVDIMNIIDKVVDDKKLRLDLKTRTISRALHMKGLN